MLTAVVIMALWAAALLVVAVVAWNWLRSFFSALFVGIGVYLFRSSTGLTAGWIIVSPAIFAWIGAKQSQT